MEDCNAFWYYIMKLNCVPTNTYIFIGIFYGFIIKNCFWKAHKMRFVEKLKLVRYMYRNSFHFKVFVKNLSKYITCWNVLLQYNKKQILQQ